MIYLVVLSGYAAITLGWEASKPFRGEDHLIENLGAFFFFAASILYFVCFWLSSRSAKETHNHHPKRNGFYFFLAVLFFIGLGEEISWGQRIIGWETPQFIKEFNRQDETNFHNIRIFDNKGKWDKDKTPVLSLFSNFTTWYFLFWFSYCLILPLANRYSLRSSRYCSRLGLPVPPLWIGLLLLVNFSMYAIPYLFSLLGRMSHGFTELKESYDAFIFAVLAYHELKKQLLLKRRINVRE